MHSFSKTGNSSLVKLPRYFKSSYSIFNPAFWFESSPKKIHGINSNAAEFENLHESKNLYEKLSEKLHVKYLSDAAQELDEVKGIIFGNYHRPFVVMTMKINGKIKNVFFLVDTGTSHTYISKEVLNAYNLEVPTSCYKVRLNKRKVCVSGSRAHSQFSNFNVLGTDYLFNNYSNDAQLSANFDQKYFTIKFDIDEDEDDNCETYTTQNCKDILVVGIVGIIVPLSFFLLFISSQL